MVRPKAVVQPPSAPNMGAINDILAKARSLVGSVKRTASDQELETPTTTKARTAAVPSPAKAVGAPPKATPSPVPPTRVRGKSPAPATKSVAVPKPPPPHAATEVATPSPKTVSPAGSFESSEPSPSERTKAYLLNAKKLRLEQEALKTPPPKTSFASPAKAPSPPKAASPQLESPVHNSYVSYCASQGKSWWASDAGPFGKSWWFDPCKRHYVYAKGTQCWISDTDDWYGSWTLQEESPTTIPDEDDDMGTPSTDNGMGHDSSVRDFLATRQPTGLTDSSESQAVECLDGDELEVPEEPRIPGDAKDEQPKVPQGAKLPEEAKGAEEAKVPHAGAPGTLPSPAPAAPAPVSAAPVVPRAVQASEAYRLDKFGNPISPEALYMRFYRRLRSFLFAIRVQSQLNIDLLVQTLKI
eukprot:s4821_g3.t1